MRTRMKKVRNFNVYDVIPVDDLGDADLRVTVSEGIVMGVNVDPKEPNSVAVTVDLGRDGMHEFYFSLKARKLVRYNSIDEIEYADANTGYATNGTKSGGRHALVDTNVMLSVEENRSRFERVGGIDALKAVVGRAYEYITSDPQLAIKFRGADVERIKRHQVKLFEALLKDDMNLYRGRALGLAHAGLGLTDELYDLTVHYIVKALNDFNVDEDIVEYLMEKLEAARELIVAA